MHSLNWTYRNAIWKTLFLFTSYFLKVPCLRWSFMSSWKSLIWVSILKLGEYKPIFQILALNFYGRESIVHLFHWLFIHLACFWRLGFSALELWKFSSVFQVPFLELHGESTEYVGRAEDAIIALSNYRLHIKFKESLVNVSDLQSFSL